MSYTATKTVQPRDFAFPAGFDQTAKLTTIRGTLVEDNNAANYSVGGIGSSAFEVTAFSSVGLVTFTSLLGQPLINGERVVIYNTSSNTNDGTYIVSQLVYTSATAGTFVAVPIPGKTLAGSSQTTQTAEGVGQLLFSERNFLAQAFTVSAVTFSGGIATLTYSGLTGPELTPGDSVTISGMTNAGNNGKFSLNAVFPTSATAGSFQISNPFGVASDSGTGTGSFRAGIDSVSTFTNPIQLTVFTSKGYAYEYDLTNNTVRIYLTGSAANNPLAESALGATVAYDGTLTFEALFVRSKPS